MSRRGRRKSRKKFPLFAAVMVIYVIVGVIVSFVLWGKLRSYAEDYEASLPKYGMDEVIAALSANNVESVVREDTLVTELKYEGLEEYRTYLKQKLAGKSVTMQEAKAATKEVPRYLVLADGEPVMEVSLKVTGKNAHDMDLWGYDKIYADKYSISDLHYEITVPTGSVVRVNNVPIGDAEIARDENGEARITEIADLQVIREYVDELPSFTTYEVSGFLLEPQISATDKNNSPLQLTREDNLYSAGLPVYQSAADEVAALVPTIMEAYGNHFIGLNSGGIYQYLLPGSQYKEDLKTATTYFYPTSRITSHTFSNEKCEDFVTYSEDCVSCHIYFDLIVTFNSAAYKTKNEGADATWIFVKRDGTWYLAQVLRQKNIEYKEG
ncbi:MAG: hypothetical protein K6E50_06155 [Lachnospiraceae bacterium]|nr:hypothetical protein [Lachnospiraceae bacterium]